MKIAPKTAPLHLVGSLACVAACMLVGCQDSVTPAETNASGDAGAASEASVSVSGAATPAEPTTSTRWTTFRGDARLTGVSTSALSEQPSELWRVETGGPVVSSPVVSDGVVYVGSDDGKLYALDAASGSEVWAYQTEDVIEAPPLIHDGVIYIGSHDYRFYAIDAKTGDVKWSVETGEKVVAGANTASGTSGETLIVFGSHDATVYGVHAQTGDIAWAFETADRVNATVAVDAKNRVIFGGCDTKLYVLDGATGDELASMSLGAECNVAASVGVSGEHVYFGHNANAFIAIDLAKRERSWTYPNDRFGFFSPPAVTADRVVFGGRDRHVHCVDRVTGEPIWSFKTRRKVDAAPTVAGDFVVAGSGDGRLYLLRLDTGEEVWSADLGRSVFSSPAVVDGVIYVGSNDGAIYAFGGASEAASEGKTTDG